MLGIPDWNAVDQSAGLRPWAAKDVWTADKAARQRHQQKKVVCTLKLPWLSNLREMPCLLA